MRFEIGGSECHGMWDLPIKSSRPSSSPSPASSSPPSSPARSASPVNQSTKTSGSTVVHRPIPLSLSVAQDNGELLIRTSDLQLRTKMPVHINWPDPCLLGCALYDAGFRVSLLQYSEGVLV